MQEVHNTILFWSTQSIFSKGWQGHQRDRKGERRQGGGHSFIFKQIHFFFCWWWWWSTFSSFLNFYLIFIGIQLLHNVVLVSGTQPNESDTPLFIFNISLRLLLCLHKLFLLASQQQVRKTGRGRLGGRNWGHQPTTTPLSCNAELFRFLYPSLSGANGFQWEWTLWMNVALLCISIGARVVSFTCWLG